MFSVAAVDMFMSLSVLFRFNNTVIGKKNEAYNFLYSLSDDLIANSKYKIKDIKVLKRFGELIIGAVVSTDDCKKLNSEYKLDSSQAVYDNYYGFTVFYLDEESEISKL